MLHSMHLFGLVLLAGGGDPGPTGELATSAVEPIGLLPRAVTSFGAAADGDWLYVLGGYFGATHDYDREGQSRSFARYRIDDPSLREELEGAGALQGARLVAHAGALYRVGGMVAHNAPDEPSDMESIAECARFDLDALRWERLPSLPEGRSSHAALAHGGKLYVIGGWRLDGRARGGDWGSSALVLDLQRPGARWESVAAPFRRRALAAASAGGFLVAIGGMDEEREVSRRVDLYEPATGAWSRGPDFPEPAFGVAAVGVGGELLASAGSGSIWRWRPGADEWRCVTTQLFPRIFHELVAAPDGRVLTLGGMSPAGRVRVIEALDPAAREDGPRLSRWSVPVPASALNRQGFVLDSATLFAFGGNSSRGQHDFEPERFQDEAFALSLAELEWRERPAFPARRQSMAAAAADGRALVAGGFGHDGERARSFDDTFLLDLRSGTWSGGPALPQPRTQLGLVLEDGRAWILGGLDYDPARAEDEHFGHPLEVLRWTLDGAGGFEPTGIVLPRPRRAAGCAELEGRVHLVGGLREGFGRIEEHDVLDLESGEWTMLAPPARPRISPELVALHGRLYLAGGSSERGGESGPDPSVEVFDPATGEWSVLVDDLPISPRHLRMFAFGDRLLALSSRAEEPLLDLLVIDPGGRRCGALDGQRHP